MVCPENMFNKAHFSVKFYHKNSRRSPIYGLQIVMRLPAINGTGPFLSLPHKFLSPLLSYYDIFLCTLMTFMYFYDMLLCTDHKYAKIK